MNNIFSNDSFKKSRSELKDLESKLLEKIVDMQERLKSDKNETAVS